MFIGVTKAQLEAIVAVIATSTPVYTAPLAIAATGVAFGTPSGWLSFAVTGMSEADMLALFPGAIKVTTIVHA